MELGAGFLRSPGPLLASWDPFVLSRPRFIMLVHQNLQSEPYSCFCHLSVGNKRERGESKGNMSPPSRAWDNGCDRGRREGLSNETQSGPRTWETGAKARSQAAWPRSPPQLTCRDLQDALVCSQFLACSSARGPGAGQREARRDLSALPRRLGDAHLVTGSSHFRRQRAGRLPLVNRSGIRALHLSQLGFALRCETPAARPGSSPSDSGDGLHSQLQPITPSERSQAPEPEAEGSDTQRLAHRAGGGSSLDDTGHEGREGVGTGRTGE